MPGPWEYGSLPEVRDATADALDRARQPCIFDRFGWFDLLHRHCMADALPHVAHAQDGGAAAWLFLTEQGDNRLSAMANWYSFAFRPVFAGAPDPDIRRRLMATIARDLARTAARIDAYPVHADDGTMDMWLDAFRAAGWMAIARPMGINHFLQLDGRSFDAYWASRSSALRKIVQRRAKASPLTHDVHDRFSEALWDDYLSVYGRSWKEPEPHYPFLRALAEQESAAGTLRLAFSRLEGQPVATQMWTVENGVALVHKLAHDSGRDSLSPGTLLSHHMFRHMIDVESVATIDYGTGDNSYKRDWMEAQRTLYRIDCFNPRFASAWIPAARTAISRLVGQRARR